MTDEEARAYQAAYWRQREQYRAEAGSRWWVSDTDEESEIRAAVGKDSPWQHYESAGRPS